MTAAALGPIGGAAGPQLRADLTVVEQAFRGETSFVVKDPATHKYFRFRPVEMTVMRRFDGSRTYDEIAAALADEGVRITARVVEGFARKLASIGLLERTLVERTTLQMERLRAERRKRRRPALFRGELLRMRWSMGDPDRVFTRVMPAIRWCFTPAFVVASALLFTTYCLILAVRWDEFARTFAGLYSLGAITLGTIALLWVTGLVVIMIHELGHGFTCKHFGGEVHELGFMLIYFQPAFYCNVNDAWSFPSLRARLWVTAAGSWIQMVVASLAAIVWAVAAPGTLVSEIAIAAMIMGGLTTVVTNANPLIPLDGYFALTDWLEIPNLRMRALAYLGWWLRRHVLRLDIPEPPVTDRERRVFLIYAALAAVYITAILSFVAFLLLGWAREAFGVLGVLAVIALIVSTLRQRLAELGRSVALAARARRGAWLAGRRPRLVGLAALGLVIVLAVVPWTLTTSGRFVLAPARTLALTAPDSGIIARVLVREGTRVRAGAPLARIVDWALERELLAATRAADSLGVNEARARARGDAGVAERVAAERRAAAGRAAALRARLDAPTLRASWDGGGTTARVEEREGQRVRAGDLVLTVVSLEWLEARVALGGAGATRVRPGQRAHLATHAAPSHPLDGVVGAVAPAGAGGPIEIRLAVSPAGPWRAGATGEASIELERSTMLGAIWWGIRQRIRNDLLL